MKLWTGFDSYCTSKMKVCRLVSLSPKTDSAGLAIPDNHGTHLILKHLKQKHQNDGLTAGFGIQRINEYQTQF